MTVQLAPSPVFQAFGPNGAPLAFGLLYTYQAGTTTPQATYVDNTQTTQNTNPVVLNAYGQASVWLVTNQVYKFVLTDSSGNQLYIKDQIPGGINLTQAALGALLYPQTSAEVFANVVPTNFVYPPGNILRYGADPTGTADSTTAIQAAINQNAQFGVSAYVPSGAYTVASQLSIPGFISNPVQQSAVHLYGDGSSSIINFTSTANLDLIGGITVNSAIVEKLKLNVVNQQNGGGYVGVVAFHTNSTNISVYDCEITGATQSGILMDGCSNYRIERNYLHNFIYGTGVNDSSDIHVMTNQSNSFNADYGIIADNQCFGGNNIGISLETSQTGAPVLLMRKTVISRNRVGTHTAYGIICYFHQTGDVYNDIIDNYVEGITGASTAQGGSAGAGIYVAGCGSVNVKGNTIYNVCQQTTNSTLSPGGIGLLVTSGSPCVIANNSIYDISQLNPSISSFGLAGIYVNALPAGSVISGNVISQQVGVGSNVAYSGIQLIGSTSNGVSVTGNSINVLNTIANTRGVFLYANGTNLQNFAVTGNIINGCSTRQITLEQNGAFQNQIGTITGNVCNGGASGCNPLSITAGQQVTVTGNILNATSAVALLLSASTGIRMANNYLQTSGSTLFSTTGSCSGSYFDETNAGAAITGNINNGGTGCVVSYFVAATPAGGTNTAQIGDIAVNTAPTATGTDRWRCTTAGTPGTWTALTLP